MRTLFFTSLLLLTASNLFAAETQQIKQPSQSAKTLPEVVVKDQQEKKSLTVPSLAAAKENLARIPGGASVVAGETYKTGRSSTLQDALGYTAGVFIQPRYGSEEARLSIRGSGVQRTFHLRGIKLLQDGIPINQADGAGDFQDIDPLAFDYIEVYRGANALRYGSTTLGGAVNFVSPTGYTAPTVQGRLEVGGFNYLKDQISSGAVLGPVDYYVSLSEFRQDGFRNHSDQRTRRMVSNYGIQLGENVENRTYVTLIDSESKLPGSLTYAQMKQNPKQNNPANMTGNQKRDYDLVRVANKTTIKLDDHQFEGSVFWTRKDLFHPIFQVLNQISNDIGMSFRYLSEAPIFDRKNIFTLGFTPMWNWVQDDRYVNVGGSQGAKTADATFRSANYDIFAENQFYIFPQLAIVSGLQFTYASRKATDHFFADGNNSGHMLYHGWNPKAGLLYELTEQSQVFANVSRSFEPPSFGELTNITGDIRRLEEQSATTMEIGTRGEKGRFKWDTAYYFSWVDNELLGLNDANGNALGTINAYRTHHSGIEFGGEVDVFREIFSKINPEDKKEASKIKKFMLGEGTGAEFDRVVVRGVYNWSNFNFVNDPAYSDNPLPGMPQHFIRTELMYEHPSGIYFGPNMEFMPQEYAVDMANTLFTYPYALMGLKGGYRTKQGLSFFVEARNLTNEIYAATTGVIADARGLDSAQFLPGDGRTVISGVEFRWG